MSFEAKDYPISEVLTKALFNIPRNQRRYVWKKDNWRELYEDICFSVLENKPHFIGSIVLEKGSKAEGLTHYSIIDGQQRIITITIMLLVLMKHFAERDMDGDFGGTELYIKTKDNKNNEHIVLNSDYHLSLGSIINASSSPEECKKTLNAFVDSHIVSKQKDKCIGEAFKYFYNKLKEDAEKSDNPDQYLVAVKDSVLDMRAIRIESTSEDDSYTIFEILNARGQALQPHELLKNFIMRYIQPVGNRDNAKAIWEDMERTLGSKMNKFVKHYTTHRYGDIRDKYATPYQAIQNKNRGQNANLLLEDMKLKSEYYNKIINPSIEPDGNCSAVEFDVFSFFRNKKFEQFRPIILSLMHQKELEKLSIEKYELTLKYISNFFVCYTIIGEEKSNKLEDLAYKYARLLEEDYSDDLLQEFASNLKRKIPSEDWFVNAFKLVGWSNHHDLYKGEKNKTRVQIILEVIEKFVSQKNQVDTFTIEHMLPDSESEENAQIGNLIPLEEALNGKCKTKPIKEKIEIYSNSNFASARGVAGVFKEKELIPAKRTKFLAELLYRNILELNQFDYSKST